MAAADARTRFQEGVALAKSGRKAEALAAYEAALALAPGLVPAHFNRGLLLREAGDLRGAALAFRAVSRADPKDFEAAQDVVATLAQAVHAGQAPFAVPPSPTQVAPKEPVSIVTCSIQPARLRAMQENFRAHLAGREHEFVVIPDAKSLAEGYTRGMAQARHDFIVFSHDDLELVSPQPFEALQTALAAHDVVGLAGSRQVTGPAVIWAGHPHIHGWVSYPAPEGGFDAAPFSLHGGVLGGMQALDGLLFAARRATVEAVGFDAATFDGFHFYDLDFTLRAHRAGRKLAVTTDVLAVHASAGNFGESWQRYRERFSRKFPGLAAPKGAHHAYGARFADRAQLLAFYGQLRGLEATP